MHIVYDYQIFALQKMGGISRYFTELAGRLPRCSAEIETTVLAPFHVNEYLLQSSVHKVGRKISSFPGMHRVLPTLNRLAGRRFLKEKSPDIFHETYYSAATQKTDAPRFLTVYDMIHERFPEQFQGVDCAIPALKAAAVARADHIIAISKSTRNDMLHYLDISPEKITVIPLAPSFGGTADVTADIRAEKRPYLLYVGLRGGVKNFQRFITAFSRSQLLRADCNVVCVGGGVFSEQEKDFFKVQGVEKCVLHLQADDTRLASLYSRAELFVYPSLYEGFGLPIVEAMHCGCPVVCSNTSSMPEIAGKAALYFDPLNVEELSAVMESVVGSPERADALRTSGYEQAGKFSWDTCVQQTAALYRSAV